MTDEEPQVQSPTQKYAAALSEEFDRTIGLADLASPTTFVKKTLEAVVNAKAAHLERVHTREGEEAAQAELTCLKSEVARLGHALGQLNRVGDPTTERELAADDDPLRRAMLVLAEVGLVVGVLTPARAAETRRTIRELDLGDALALRELVLAQDSRQSNDFDDVEQLAGEAGEDQILDAALAGRDAVERLGSSLETLERLHCVSRYGGRVATHFSGQPIRAPTPLGRWVFEALGDFFKYYDQVVGT